MLFSKFLTQNISVIPLVPGKKFPSIKGWEKYCEELPSEADAAAWDRLSSVEPLGYGLCLGPASGLVAVDIDDVAYIEKVPESSYVKRGKKGETRFFKYSGEKSQKFRHLGIEILSLGNQTAIPPSIHPETRRPYEWTNMYEGFSSRVDLTELPIGFIENLERLNTLAKLGAEEEVKLGRHVSLVKVMTSLVAQGKSLDDVREELLDYDKKKHKPQYFTDPSGQSIEYFMSTMLKSLNAVELKDPNHIDLPEPSASDDGDEDEESGPDEKDFDPCRPPAIDFLEPRGLMKDVYDLVRMRSTQEATKPLATAAALSFMSMFCARKFWGNLSDGTEKGDDVTPNIYSIGLAASGMGKDAPQKVLKEILFKRGLLDISKSKSGSVLISGLKKLSIRLDLLDETHHLFESMNSTQPHLEEIMDFYLQLYSCANDTFGGSKMMTDGGTTKNIEKPHISLLGFTTPASFRSAVSLKMAENGLFARMCFFNCGKSKLDLSRLRASWSPEEYAVLISRIDRSFEYTRKIQEALNGGNMVADDFQVRVLFESDALVESDSFHRMCLRKQEEHEGHWSNSIYARLRENAAKYALLDHFSLVFAATLDRKTPPSRIGIDSVQWGQAMVLSCFGSVYPELERLASSGKDYDQIVTSVMDAISSSPHGFPAYTLRKRYRDKRVFPEAIKNLSSLGQIYLENVRVPGSRQISMRYLNKAQRKELVKLGKLLPLKHRK